MPDSQSYYTLKSAIESFAHIHGDHPLLKDSVGQLKVTLYDIEPVFMSPGQKAAREVDDLVRPGRVTENVMPTGQEPIGQQPVHQ